MRAAASIALLSLLLLLLAASAGAQSLKGIRKEFAAVGEEVIPATVTVRSPAPRQKWISGSTGVIVHPAGYVFSDADATLVDVKKNAAGENERVHGRDAIVRLPAPDFREFRAIVVRRDPETDTTLLKIVDPIKGKLPYVPMGTSENLMVGAFNVVVGNAFGSGMEGEPALSMGSISALLGRDAPTGGRFETIYTSAAVNRGSNGGPCVDAEGRLVGIVSTWEQAPSSPFRALGKVTPIERVRAKYTGVEDFDLIFPDPKSFRPRSDQAAIVEQAFNIVANHAFPSLASLEVVREDGVKASYTIPNRKKALPQFRNDPNTPATFEVPLYPGPYSAVVLSEDGYLLTCSANLWQFDKIESVTAHLFDGRSLPAEIVARDRYQNVALLKVEAEGLLPLVPAEAGEVKVGRFGLAVANPFGGARQEAPLFTFGTISGVGRQVRTRPGFTLSGLIQTDAGMMDGMVGGALVTLEGELLGINVLVNPDLYGRLSGIGFAVPMSSLTESLPRLMKGETIEPGWMGIGLGTSEMGGIVFAQVQPKGPAAEGGLMKGDRLLEADGRKSSRMDGIQGFIEFLRTKEAGQVLKLRIARSDGEHELSVTMGSNPRDF